ncbi:Sec7 domain containing protein [Tritrichomonas foetus]|uniref:Sec7 domain containing protein n=1 Tax=Tritrichomonas foetus TaxID=1144522 RepID=A0A1J4JIY0_9EUKA|nr:Sec7 domain containing protein [Tritrichomonas foetus]|eukprot:OHS97515.1 Sec7 domain containing protein [Tritrichomonas foetus]
MFLFNTHLFVLNILSSNLSTNFRKKRKKVFQIFITLKLFDSSLFHYRAKMTSLLSIVATHLKALRKACGSFGKRSLKDLLTASETQLAQNKSKISDQIIIKLLEPFFHAAELDPLKYQVPVIDCYIAIFKSNPDGGFHHPSIIDKVLRSLFTIDKFQLEENRKKAANCVFACIISKSGQIFVHSDLLLLSFTYLLRLHNSALESREMIEKIINDLTKHFISQYKKPVPILPFNTIEQAAKQISGIICTHTIAIKEYVPHCITATIRDVDIVVMIRAFCNPIGKSCVPTTLLCANTILSLLELDLPYIEKSFFVNELGTTIHVALLSLCLDGNLQLYKTTAKLISTIWKRFSENYNEGLNEVLDKGLATSLVSPSPKTMIRNFKVLSSIVEDPQFMVDTFVNYDCDKSGIFQNIFENTVNIVVKRSYPAQASIELQKEALKTLLCILENLWKYFNQFNEKTEEKEKVAKSVLNQKKEKNMIEKAQDVFKKSPNKGLLYFSSHNMCEDNAQSYADFLFETAWLDPAGVGEVIGGSKPLNLEILPLFVKHFDFKGQSFETAFRSFLSKFQIPGESQMIDRVMQEFGTKYYNDNTNMFSCADTVYVLAFSTLMLHTDAHHPNVTHHMTLDEFIRNNRGIDGGHDLPTSFLEELYKGITAKKINLTAGTAMPNIALLSQKQQAEVFKERINQTLETAKQRTTTELHQHRFHRAESPLLVGPMFQCVWGGVLAALTMSFEMTDDPEIVNWCLKGFQLCTHIASHCYVEDALATLVDSFAKFTRLRTYSSELKTKNFQCTAALLQCANNDIKFLKGAWDIILAECSALDKMSQNKSFVTDLSSINTLYIRSGALDRESIQDFVAALCKVSAQAMEENPPRDSMLHGLQQVALNNLERPMVVWREIWQQMANLFVRYGQSDKENVSLTVLSILHNIAQSFMKLEETTQMHHKETFLQPLFDIFDHQSSTEVRNRILEYVENLVTLHSKNLQSGWQIILQVLTLTVAQEPKLIPKGLTILQKIVTKSFEDVKGYQVNMLLTAVVCYVMTKDNHGKIALKAVQLFSVIASHLNKNDTAIWLILFESIQRSLEHSNAEVRSSIEASLISIVVKHGFKPEPIKATDNEAEGENNGESKSENNNEVKSEIENENYFTREVWLDFIQKLLPAVFSFNDTNNIDHLTSLLKNIYSSIFEKFLDKLIEYAKEILDFLQHCAAGTTNTGMRRESLLCLESFVKGSGNAFDDENLTNSLLEMLDKLVPEMTTSVLFVNVLYTFIDVFSNSTSENIDCIARANKYITILGNLSELCSRKRSTKGVLPTWCEARKAYFSCIVRQNREDEVVENLYETLEFYQALRQNGNTYAEWDSLVANCIGITTQMGNELFVKCTKRSTEFICNLVEVDSEDVRKELVPLLKRQLDIA